MHPNDPHGGSRRDFLKTGSLAAALGAIGGADALAAPTPGYRGNKPSLQHHRFGLNYVPSKNWYFSFNDWKIADIREDMARMAELGIDHLRVMVVWPWFQTNPKTVSTAHLDRFDQLMQAAAAENLDVMPTIYTGWLSGFRFDPVFYHKEPFYTSLQWARAQSVYLQALAARMRHHPNFMGFDIGNEINVQWSDKIAQGDAWMRRVFQEMHALAPGKVHVNGVDNSPWFKEDTFSREALIATQPIVALHCWPFWTGAGKLGGPLDKPYTHLPAAMAALVRSHARDPAKPVWIQEFGVCNVEMPEKDIPRYLEVAVEAALEEGVNWFTWWASHDVSRQYEFHPFEYDLGLLDTSNRMKPAAHVYRRLAERWRGKPVKPARTPAAPPAVRNDDATWAWLTAHMGYRARPASGQQS
ncbi:glycoside hydrolase 5 family protein [Pseudoduganella lutea]|uniref:Twin-arginine translocation signal domain-containing protein n=1 Tax=Pseudoduganella lutea TaxID=321985 RepID=A0A4P6KSM6_9BURK|nr:cellulase family glycosylhydrolase [Pseudoduganella lutea]QBE61870.1 twin-arginine translocation signal domain-containing protein [Pseudoduganella lutea]